MSSKKECAEYFKKQNGYKRSLLEMRRKWESYGRAAGRIFLCDATDEEMRALGGILGKNFYDNEIRFTMREFEAALKKTRFASVTVQELLEEYFGEALSTNQERAAAKKEEQKTFFQSLSDCARAKDMGAMVVQWFQGMEEKREYGYHVLMAEFRKDRQRAVLLAEHAGRALGEIIRCQEEVPLAVFAARCTKNPHYFDRGTAAGALLIHGICFLEACAFPKNAYDWRSLLMQVGIVPDTISNMVTEYGIHLRTGTGLHPAYEGFYNMKQPGVVTLDNLKGVQSAYSDSGIVYVVENEMVFSYLLDAGQGGSQALVCTSGQLRAAALELLDLLAAQGTKIYYSGDMDPDGILIADKLWKKYPGHICLWRMSVEDYRKSLSEENISGPQIRKLDQLENSQLRRLADEIRTVKKTSYQENLKEAMVEDLSRGGPASNPPSPCS